MRENSVIAVGAKDDGPVYDYADGVTFRVYGIKDGGKAETVVYSGGALQEAFIVIERKGDTYTVTFQGEKPCRVVLKGTGKPVAAQGAEWSVQGEDTLLSFEKSGTATVTF